MADYTRDIARWLEKLVVEQHETNKRLKNIESALIAKQFDDWIPPAKGTVYQNTKGCVMLNLTDFNEMYNEYLNKGEDDDRSEID